MQRSLISPCPSRPVVRPQFTWPAAAYDHSMQKHTFLIFGGWAWSLDQCKFKDSLLHNPRTLEEQNVRIQFPSVQFLSHESRRMMNGGQRYSMHLQQFLLWTRRSSAKRVSEVLFRVLFSHWIACCIFLDLLWDTIYLTPLFLKYHTPSSTPAPVLLVIELSDY